MTEAFQASVAPSKDSFFPMVFRLKYAEIFQIFTKNHLNQKSVTTISYNSYLYTKTGSNYIIKYN